MTAPCTARLTPDEVSDLIAMSNEINALEVINERLTAYAALLPHKDNPGELSRRWVCAYCVATTALLHSLSDRVERLGRVRDEQS